MSREVKKKKIKEEIIRNAVQLFKEKGYGNVTVEEIAVRSGIAKGTFFNYFQKKEHVLLHMAESYLQLTDRIVDGNREGAVKERLLGVLRDLLAIYLGHAELLRLTLIETIKSQMDSNEASTNLSSFRNTLRSIVEDAIACGELRTIWDADEIASVVAGVFLNTLIAGSARPNGDEMTGMLRRQLDIVWGGIADE